MKYDTRMHNRRSMRLKGYDYARPGAYFVTLATQQRVKLFGEIAAGSMRLNEYGRVADECWRRIPEHFPGVALGAFVIMPDHLHGIIQILEPREGEVLPPPFAEAARPADGVDNAVTGGGTPPRPALGQIVAYYKYQSTKKMNLLDGSGVITKLWQRNYHERIIHNQAEWFRIHRYIEANPSRWTETCDHPGDENNHL
jgi:REP element-mobilizing transposase RayT